MNTFETVSLRPKIFVYLHTNNLCCIFILLWRCERFEEFDTASYKMNKLTKCTLHSTLHIKSACITLLLVVFGTRVCFTLYLVLFANRQLISEHLLGLVVQQTLQSLKKKEENSICQLCPSCSNLFLKMSPTFNMN